MGWINYHRDYYTDKNQPRDFSSPFFNNSSNIYKRAN